MSVRPLLPAMFPPRSENIFEKKTEEPLLFKRFYCIINYKNSLRESVHKGVFRTDEKHLEKRSRQEPDHRRHSRRLVRQRRRAALDRNAGQTLRSQQKHGFTRSFRAARSRDRQARTRQGHPGDRTALQTPRRSDRLRPALHEPFWGEFTRGIEDELREHADVTFRQTSLVESFLWTGEEIPEHIRRGGLLLLGTASEEFVRRIRQSRIPFALVFDANPAGKYPFFSVDLEPAIDEIVARFARAGCSRVAYIGTEGDHNMGRENINRRKHRLFNAALERHGLPVLPELHSDCLHFMRCGYRAIRELLEKHRAPDAVFFASDVLAPGGYKALHEAGLHVPEDVVAAGCDNLEIGDYVVPPLTTIEFDRYGIGRAAASGLVARLHGRESIPSRFFPAAIVNRESFPIQHS